MQGGKTSGVSRSSVGLRGFESHPPALHFKLVEAHLRGVHTTSRLVATPGSQSEIRRSSSLLMQVPCRTDNCYSNHEVQLGREE